MNGSVYDVAVVGGGVSGLTTAVLLQVNGYRTTLYAQATPGDESDVVPAQPDVAGDPEFATLHAAASILPHSVKSPSVADWTKVSQEFFEALTFQATCGVRSQTHYEIFESFDEPPPPYALSVRNFETLTEGQLEVPWVPRRPGAQALCGWKFDAFFCEAPEYVRYLGRLFRGLGGQVRRGSELPGPGLADYLALGFDFYVNCTGQSAQAFLATALANTTEGLTVEDEPGDSGTGVQFEPLIDPFPPKLVRGHYLRVDIKRILTGDRSRFFSYNYKPDPAIYRTESGQAADVYCYPRSDAWILGGSRQEGKLVDGNWDWQETVGDELHFPCAQGDAKALAVPAPIFTLNADLLLGMHDASRRSDARGRVLDLRRLQEADPSLIMAGVGYRFVRDSEDASVRLAASRLRIGARNSAHMRSTYVFHNYGHGGSGFTLSWGCAFYLLQMLDSITGAQRGDQAPSGRQPFLTDYRATRMVIVDLCARLSQQSPSEG